MNFLSTAQYQLGRKCQEREEISDVPYPIDRIFPLVQHHIDIQDLNAGRVIPHTLDMKHIMEDG